MKLVVITPEHILDNEATVINRLFSEGLEILHLRKPEATEHDLCKILDKIHSDNHRRIVLHDHFALVKQYNLKGVHLNRRNPEPLEGQYGALSKSYHSLSELKELDGFSYVFLSPVFDSISKSGYNKAFTENELVAARDEKLIGKKVYALGGISLTKISLAANYGFGGVVVLGTLWSEFEHNRDEPALLKRFGELRDKCYTYIVR